MKEKIKIYSLIFIGILYTYILYQSYHYDNIFQIFFYVILGGIGLYILYYSIFNEIEQYKKSKKLKSFLITFIGIFFILLNLGIYIYYELKI